LVVKYGFKISFILLLKLSKPIPLSLIIRLIWSSRSFSSILIFFIKLVFFLVFCWILSIDFLIKFKKTLLNCSLSLLKNKYSTDLAEKNKVDFNENLKIINNQIKQIEKLVNEFSDFARMPKPIFYKNNLITLLNENIKFISKDDGAEIKIIFIK